jgi:hypothetical protein
MAQQLFFPSVIVVDTSGNCQVCGAYSDDLHHFGEMCDKGYAGWCEGYRKAWSKKK